MKIGYRVFLGFILALALGYYGLISWIIDDAAAQPKKSLEESLVDTAHILATFLEQHILDRDAALEKLGHLLDDTFRRRFSARIYGLEKNRVDLGVYVTDMNGIVVYDSHDGKSVGRDFSVWNDVVRTLEGGYGARTTRSDPDDPASAAAYVAAPVYSSGRIVAVCTVVKPLRGIYTFISTTRAKIVTAAVLGFLFVALLSFVVSRYITRPIRRLTDHAYAVKMGVDSQLPPLADDEIGDLGTAFEEMRQSLDGKTYVEEYVQALTHQIKGPLAAIYGAAELLQEDPGPRERARFAANIERESARIGQIVERLLELAAIERRSGPGRVEKINFHNLVEEIVESLAVTLKKKGVTCFTVVNREFEFKGEPFLVKQALVNLVQNAVEFTPPGGEITVSVTLEKETDTYVVTVTDTGSGIPGYALGRIFERFYSLPRPGSRRKSSGLGLFLVKEVARLHGGTVHIENNPDKGATAVLRLPRGRRGGV